MSDELTREHAMAEIIEALQAKVTALEQERDEWHKKADDLFAVYTQWDKLDKAEAIAKANDLAARVRVLEEVFERHKAREKYIAEIVYQHIKHGDEKHQDWLRRELVNVICTEDTKACKTFDDLQQQLATAQQELAELKLAMNCPLALSCLCCGKLMQPTDIAVRWRDSMIVVCFACRDARAEIKRLKKERSCES